MKKTLFAMAGLTLAFLGTGRAQVGPPSPDNGGASAPMFPFVMPWDDAAPGTATDVSFLNARPAGVNGRIVVKNGHFAEGNTGRRVNFLGVNIVAGNAFRDHADAEKVAARLAKLGVNIVRLHHMDNSTWGAGQNIWDVSVKDRQHIDPKQLDKLDYLIAQLKKNGIYVDLNLHVSRSFSEADGFPASVTTLDYGKRVDQFERRMIQLQKNYAHDLLAHVNPYTKMAYTDDPAVAVVEINNENSLVGDPWASLGAGLDTLPEPFRGELVGQWNAWLAKKYGTDAKLQAAWLQGATPPGPSLVSNKSVWSIEHQGTSQAAIADLPLIGGTFRTKFKIIAQSAPPVQINITKIDDTVWHVQAHQTGLDFNDGATYTVSFQAKADSERTMNVGAGLDQADWHNIGLSANAKLGTDWKPFTFVFDTHGTVPQHGRVAFQLGDKVGTVWISDLQVRPGAEGAGLWPGQSLASKNIDIPTSATKAQKADWMEFLVDTERAYADEMRGYLKNDLHVKANVIESQMGYGGLSSVYREANSDFADNHAYWQHPSFPNKPWDPIDWNIGNTPMVSDLANGGSGTLRDLAEYRIANKPYSISEYNHPAPNDFQAEAVPILASFAAFQDWDIIYLFDYGDYGATAATDKIQGFFAVGSNPAKMAFFPAAALMFRAGELAPASDFAQIASTPAGWQTRFVQGTGTADHAWQTGGKAPNFLTTRLAISQTASARATQARDPRATRLRTVKTPSGGLYIAVGPNAASVVGFVGGQIITVDLNTAVLTFPTFGNNFAAVTLTPLDQKPLAQSRHLLLTLAGKVENQGMVWNAAHNSVTDQWGHGPTLAEGIPATVQFGGRAVTHVYALDGTGKRVKDVPVIGAQFTVGPQYQTLWYEIVR